MHGGKVFISKSKIQFESKSQLLKVDDNDISAALGHSIGGVTQTYIHRNQEYIDKINRKLLDKVFKTPKLSLPRKSSKNRYKNCNLHDHD